MNKDLYRYLVSFKRILKNTPHTAGRIQELCSPTYWRQQKEWARTWAGIHTLVFFVGSGQSGHSLIGHLLNQHPNIAISNEFSSIKRINLSGKRNIRSTLQQTLYAALKTKNVDFMARGGSFFTKLNTEYSESPSIRVLGDKKGGESTQILRQTNFDILQGIEDTKKTLKLISVIRNPYDAISTRTLRSTLDGAQKPAIQLAEKLGTQKQAHARLSKNLPDVISRFFNKMQVVQGLTERYGEALILIHYHEFVAEPRQQLRKLLNFLDVAEPSDYLDEAPKQVRSNSRSRDLIKYVWTDSVRAEVAERMSQFDFLANYSFESD